MVLDFFFVKLVEKNIIVFVLYYHSQWLGLDDKNA